LLQEQETVSLSMLQAAATFHKKQRPSIQSFAFVIDDAPCKGQQLTLVCFTIHAQQERPLTCLADTLPSLALRCSSALLMVL
jgi:hypothetical protein